MRLSPQSLSRAPTHSRRSPIFSWSLKAWKVATGFSSGAHFVAVAESAGIPRQINRLSNASVNGFGWGYPAHEGKKSRLLIWRFCSGLIWTPASVFARHNCQWAVVSAQVKGGLGRRAQASVPCVPSMFGSWRGESPRTNLMEVKDSEAQGLPSRDGV